MSTLALYLRQWRLKLSEGKTVTAVFHLNYKKAKRELDVYINNRRLNVQPTTTCLVVGLGRVLSCRRCLAGLGVGGTFCRLPCPVGRGPAGWLECGRWGGGRPPAGCVYISPHHPGAARDWGWAFRCWCVGLGPVRESGLRLRGGPMGSGSRRRGVRPMQSTVWSPWLDWCRWGCGSS